MDAKLNQSDLISLLAKGSNISVAKAELFTKNFFDLIIEGLEQDGIVKINGLGTFKITDVASRDSVNVNTGEKIEIKGHKKLTFIPADALKDEVNQPFAMFEPVEVDDTYQPDAANDAEGEDASDTAEPANETDATPQPAVEEPEVAETASEDVLENAVNEEIAESEPEAKEETDIAVEVAVEEVTETAIEEEKEETAALQPVESAQEETAQEPQDEPVVLERPAEPVIVRVPKKKGAEEKHSVPAKNKKSRWHFYLIAIMAVAVALIFINRRDADNVVAVENSTDIKSAVAVNDVKDVVPEVTEPATTPQTENSDVDTTGVTKETASLVETPVVNEPVAEESQTADTYTFVMVDELASKSLKDITLADTMHYFAEGELCKHTVAVNETLTKIARQYYGDKKLWPYIVEYNNMKNPDGLCCGTQISIPRLIPRR